MSDWIDPDDAPFATKEMGEIAQISRGGKVIRPATGYLGPNGIVRTAPYTIPRGRPVEGESPKKQVTLRLDADLIARFREGGPGWQTRLNATLRKAVGMN